MDVQIVRKKKLELEDEINGLLHKFSEECDVDISNLVLDRDIFRHWDGDERRNKRICVYGVRLVVEI
jgi:hypothetical protein